MADRLPARPVVIVDGYSNAASLVTAFARRGHACVHVLSTAEPRPAMIPPRPEDYREWLLCPDDAALEQVLARLRDLDPVAVLAGQEPGVPLADTLGERLGLATNGTALSAARRDKYEMIEALRAAGIRCADQYKTDDPDAAAAWAVRHGRSPVVVKPLSSASSDHVFVCRTPEEVAGAARRVLAAHSMFAERNTEVLVQEFLAGPEFAVDCVSADGSRYLAGVWESERRPVDGGRTIYDMCVLRDPGADPVPALTAYVGTVLDTLGIRHGPSHAEVIVTPRGPTLVEVGARLNGAMNADFYDTVFGTNVAELVAHAYTRPADFARRFGGRAYRPVRAAAVYESPTALDGVVAAVETGVVDRITGLPAVHSVAVRSGPGRRLRPTEDLLTSPLRVFLAGPDEASLRRDRALVDGLKDQVYRLL
ncbi:ATP-grasp domain-containing protein [Kitasatospora sp. NPDC088346]|uniref:ATP-grasp domain-containing protein n=1 Tax=Kitasatospora sp. NPDC088346 TaxID=3364073 RepID=UPI00382D834E